MEPVKIEGTKMTAVLPEGQAASMSVEEVLAVACPPRMNTCGTVVPDGFRLAYPRGQFTIWVHEIPPRVYQFKWIANDSPAKFGEGTTYRPVRIALPYVIVLAVFEGDMLSDSNECFFRTKPLVDAERDELLYPGLLNCSKFSPPDGKPLSWICTQNLDRRKLTTAPDAATRMRAGLEVLIHCLFESGFNYSSDLHEASSWFTESNRVDRRIATVEKWEEATKQDPLFAVDVPWLKTGLSVKQVVERIFKNRGACEQRVASADDFARVIFNHQPRGRRRRVAPAEPKEIPF